MRKVIARSFLAAGTVLAPVAGLYGGTKMVADSAHLYWQADRQVPEETRDLPEALTIQMLGAVLTVGAGVLTGVTCAEVLAQSLVRDEEARQGMVT